MGIGGSEATELVEEARAIVKELEFMRE